MKRIMIVLLLFATTGAAEANEKKIVEISTKNLSLIYRVGDNDRLYQVYFGRRLNHPSDTKHLSNLGEAYITHGLEDYFEPAVRVTHNDGNPSLLLKYVSHQTSTKGPSNETVVVLRDDKYPVEVKLRFVAYPEEDVVCTSTEITHGEKAPVALFNYASSMLHFRSAKYFLTEFSGDWAREANMSETPLTFGKKILDSKLGSRASMFAPPFFVLSLNRPCEENTGEVLLGTLGWTGNFRFTFEVDQNNRLRIVSGINPYASEYMLKPGEVFRTPEFIFTYGGAGKGPASRNFHRWALRHRLKDGDKPRLTLLNNWEATGFDFNESKLVAIMDEAVKLGTDMFLLDDGWFANKYPRGSDRQGLGDWEETRDKLPGGVGKLTDEAKKRNLKFGIWVEPEMVNPKSELYENHKDWVILLPNRDEYYFRHQLVLDLSNPKVRDHVFGVIDKLMTKYPDVAYLKWDCNSPVTNIYSPYLNDRQSHLYVEHVRGLYDVLERMKRKYPSLPMMLCAGGGGRSDYEALKYFTEFWPSDNTEPVERIFIQWGYGHFFPSKAIAAHVTSWGKQPVKFRTDVAMTGKLGFDIRIDELSEPELEFCRNAVKNFKRLESTIGNGDLYRLHSPYEGNHAALMYVGETGDTAVLFAFDINPRYGEPTQLLRLDGLQSDKKYELKEINLMPGTESHLACNGKTYSGEYLMNVGIPVFSSYNTKSYVIEIVIQ